MSTVSFAWALLAVICWGVWLGLVFAEGMDRPRRLALLFAAFAVGFAATLAAGASR